MLDLAGEDFQEGGLARPVSPNNAVAIPRGKFKVNVFKKTPLPISQGELCYCNQEGNLLSVFVG
jgi:predicted transcriptional regulator